MPHRPTLPRQSAGNFADPHTETWSCPPSQVSLGNRDVHVWRAALDHPHSVAKAFYELLSLDERQRACRFHFSRDRDRFIVARGTLRSILSRYLFVPPSQHQFNYGPYGKPRLDEPGGGTSLHFNISHAHNLALFAFTRHRDLGIDLEYIRESASGPDVAERFFSSQEVASLRGLPTESWTQGFFNCWTRKEAYIKATGNGLSIPLNQFAVSLVPGEPAAMLATAHNDREAVRWSIREISPAPDYVAAIVVEGTKWDLKCWQWGNSPSFNLSSISPGFSSSDQEASEAQELLG